MAILSNIEHVTEREGEYFVGQTRVTLRSVIVAWERGGEKPESIITAFPTVSLADAYGAVAFYLDHRTALDGRFAEQRQEFERLRAESQATDPTFHVDLRRRMDDWAAKHPRTFDADGKDITPPESPDVASVQRI